uniref:BTB domain-containing protein n=1 Tax=Pyramimonas obovata TaxID=1411642 RepID=A0A7S0QT22_9CHLO|mmetsp:Transcript_19094/g.41805  ORF Transcript_19094/g.41805 Transcript_19094/m.41805 type:complete len:350 (+) Transcript_19094:202-1251(+)
MDDLQRNFDVLKESIQNKLAEIVHSQEQLEVQSEETLMRIREERRLLDEEKSRMTEVMKFHRSKVKLDVGGCKYTTSLATLTSVPDSMLGAMFSGRFPLEPDEEDGSFFIDRDGHLFKYVLNFMRDPVSFDAPLDQEIARDLLKEAKYFGIPPLCDLLEDPCYMFKKSARYLPFSSAERLDGALDYVGRGERAHEWRNPVEDNKVEVLLSDGDDGGGDPVECICDHDCEGGSVENCYDGVPGETSLCIHFRGHSVLLDHYMLAQEPGDDNYLREWVLEGSRDGITFETISSHIDFAITAESLQAHWPVTPNKPYPFFRLRLLGLSSGAKCNFCITQVELWGWIKNDSKL